MRKRIVVLFLIVCSSWGIAQESCEHSFPVKVKDSILVLNDGTDKRFFLSGMVDNDASSGMQLSNHDGAVVEQQMIDAKSIGANAIRWNAFLKGLDFEWDANGNVTGVCPSCLSNLKEGLDLAYENKLVVQIVLSTAHFYNFGWGGPTNVLNGISNEDRVTNNYNMMTTEQGIQDYINHVIDPMCDTIGTHPALFGFVIINEAYGMTSSEDTPNGSWSDCTARLNDLRRFVNRVSGALHRNLPGTICSVSGTAQLINQYDNDSLIQYGGDADGILDINQIQYYPNNHLTSYSPFSNTLHELRLAWDFENKPTIAGEFPISGIEISSKNTESFTLAEAYDALWQGTYSGGFTWSNVDYYNSTGTDKTAIEEAYSTFNNSYLSTLDPWENWSELFCDDSTITSTSPLKELRESEIQVHPNPTTGSIIFNRPVKYQIMTLEGRMIESGYGKTCDISTFNTGIYFIATETSVIRIVKE